eukprot:1149241-Heterocapsa_arctica.AAC.1
MPSSNLETTAPLSRSQAPNGPWVERWNSSTTPTAGMAALNASPSRTKPASSHPSTGQASPTPPPARPDSSA